MSSRGREARRRGGSGGFIVAHPAEDLVADPPTEGPDCLGLRVALGATMFEVRPAWALPLELGDCDPVEGDVDLTVAGSTQAVPLRVARPDRQRRRAVVAGERGPRPEATDAGRLADELGRGQRAAAGQGQEGRSKVRDQALDLALQAVDRRGQIADPDDELTGDPSDGAGGRREVTLDRGQDDHPVKASGDRLMAGIKLVEVPAEAVLSPGPLGDQILAMIDKEADLAIGSVEGGDRQILTEGRPGDGQGVDRIGLAGLPAGPPSAGHQLRWDPDHPLAGDEEVVRQPTGEVATVLEGPGPISEAGGPADELEMARARRREGLLGELPAGPVDGHRGVGALVRIDADDDHLRCCLLIRGDAPDRPVDTPEWGRLPRSYEVTPVGPIHVRQPAYPLKATPQGGQPA